MFNLRNLIHSQTTHDSQNDIDISDDDKSVDSLHIKIKDDNQNLITFSQKTTKIKKTSKKKVDIIVNTQQTLDNNQETQLTQNTAISFNNINFIDDISIDSDSDFDSNELIDKQIETVKVDNKTDNKFHLDHKSYKDLPNKPKTWLQQEMEKTLLYRPKQRRYHSTRINHVLYRLAPDGIENIDRREFMPGLLNLNKIDHGTKTTINERHKFVEILLYDCFFAKDYEGTMMTIKTMYSLTDFRFSHLVVLIDTLCNTKPNSNQYLSQLALTLCIQRPEIYAYEIRKQLLGIFINAFIYMNDLTFIYELLLDFKNDVVVIQYKFQCLMSLFEYYNIKQLTNQIINQLDKHTLTNILTQYHMTELPANITDNLLDYSIYIHIIYNFSLLNPNSYNDNELNGLIVKCQDLFNRLDELLNKIIIQKNLLETSCDMQALYIAYLEGTNQSEAAYLHLKSICFSISNYYKELKQNLYYYQTLGYFELYISYLCQYRLYDYHTCDIADINLSNNYVNDMLDCLVDYILYHYVNISNNILIPTLSPKLIHLTKLLYQIDLIDKTVVINLLCNIIENLPVINMYSYTNNFTEFHFYLWKSLSELIGPLDTMIDTNKVIDSNNQLYSYLSDISDCNINLFSYLSKIADTKKVFRNNKIFNYYYNNDFNAYSDINTSSDDDSKSDSLIGRIWWSETILSSDQLGNYQEILIDNINDYIDSLVDDVVDNKKYDHRSLIKEIIGLYINSTSSTKLNNMSNDFIKNNSHSINYLSNKLLLLLTYQIIVNSYIIGCDSHFSCRGIQIISCHLSNHESRNSSIDCLNLLASYNINIERALNLSYLLSKVDNDLSANSNSNPNRFSFISNVSGICNYFGDPKASSYEPL